MNKTHVLVVDDDKSILRMLEYGLKKLGPEYQIHTAKDMFSAINQIEKQWFDLILTDYMMPGMTGVDLARAVHRLAPDTQIVLMTAYGTSKLRDTTAHIGFDGYLDKPFDIEKVRDIIRRTREESLAEKEFDSNAANPPAVPEPASDKDGQDAAPVHHSVDEALRELQVNAGARAIILINIDGSPIKVAGQIDTAKATEIAALVASNFLKVSDLSSLLDNKKTFKSGFYEGDRYNIYICDVNEASLLAVIFDAKLRPGVVWFYTKQTATTLVPLLA